eukprot:CAMPEP_0195621132 /NCGR_PEP_ID=MMETSP0815-20121206/15527_1 /TAXON_ID=97485 /ORGANISM="Prymnesium parvum, Strain Texoma1" /LENGTH=462 /DNA_ID=CAMNT_0040761863 /DNA_START=14 /DNA_END=1402 /DNA_ORIENTATION=+
MKVLVVGGGPIGLEAAVLLVKTGFEVLLVERGSMLAASVHLWRHVHLFSSNDLNCSTWGLHALSELGDDAPISGGHPTGSHYIESYLSRLGAWLASQPLCTICLNTTVDAISRGGLLKNEQVKAAGEHARDEQPFEALLVKDGHEEVRVRGISAVLDCSGTYLNPNFLGRGGAPALGERSLRSSASQLAESSPGAYEEPASRFFFRGLPDVLGDRRAAFVASGGGVAKFRRVAIVGCGYSAATVLLQLRELAMQMPDLPLEVDWMLRREVGKEPYAPISNDPLPTRASLINMANAIARGDGCPANMTVRTHRGCAIDELSIIPNSDGTGGCLQLMGEERDEANAEQPMNVLTDVIVSVVGYRPDMELSRELQVHHCYASEGPMALASSLLSQRIAAKGTAAAGDCLQQKSAGAELLATPEPHFYLLGSKAYGRHSSFLLKHGHDHVKAVVDMLQKDFAEEIP